MRPCKGLIRGLFALTLVGGASACVSYPVYEPGPAPSTGYYIEEPWGCDPYYGPCAPGYGYSSGYWYGGYYGYPHYGYPYYGYPRHDHPRHDDDDDRSDWIRNWPPRDRPADPPPRDRPGSGPGHRPGNKPGVVYAPKPPRLIPDDRKIPRDPGPSVQRDTPKPVPARKPRTETESAKPSAPEAEKETSKPQRKQPARTRDSRQLE
jgi:hypothetical protein